MFDKIKILLIDDDPNYFYKGGGEPKPDEMYPVIRDDSMDGQRSRFMPELNLFFDLSWLQSPFDIKEYLYLTHAVEAEYSMSYLGDEEVVPEIVCFDYSLVNGLNLHLPFYVEAFKNLIPNYRLSRVLGKIYFRSLTEMQAYTIPETAIGITPLDDNEKRRQKIRTYFTPPNAGSIGVAEDNWGAYGGGLIVSKFAPHHPCSAIPTTRKTQEAINKSETPYFEWLLQETFNHTFDYKARSSPKWFELIPLGVKILREQKIIDLLKKRKLFLDLAQLNRLSIGNVGEYGKRVLTFESTYGKRSLPLDGLFIDFARGEERNQAIQDYATKLLSYIDISAVEGHYERIYNTFKDKFLDRILLSDYAKRRFDAKNEVHKNVPDEWQITLKALETQFQVENGTISSDQVCSILDKNLKLEKDELRLLILLLVTRFWIEHQKSKSHWLLGKEDYFNVLNPIVNTAAGEGELVLQMHSKTGWSDFCETFYTALNRKTKIPRSTWHDFKTWITAAEKQIVRSTFYQELEELNNIPDWLI